MKKKNITSKYLKKNCDYSIWTIKVETNKFSNPKTILINVKAKN